MFSFLFLRLSAKYFAIFTLLSYTVCPSYLAITSRRMVEDADLPSRTRYNTWCSSNKVAMLLMFLSSCLIVGVIVEAVTGHSS
mgnify:CR=1 FL=1